MNAFFNKVVRFAKEELVGLPMAALTVVVVFAAVRIVAAQADKSQPGLGAKIKSWFTL